MVHLKAQIKHLRFRQPHTVIPQIKPLLNGEELRQSFTFIPAATLEIHETLEKSFL